ncbi:MAG: BamA/TamA family outer membrane protein [Holosporales bacterium]|jgi:translocation and assembly module TamA|nr:BamA/TamA family outer membrane protein [Holosporales bacterium]
MVFCIGLANSAEIEGVANSEILELIKSQISNWKDFRPDSISEKFKLRKDTEAIKKVLNSFGYFDSEVKVTVQKNKVIFKVELSERYKFDDIALKYTDQKAYHSGLTVSQVFDLIKIERGSYCDTKNISDGADKITDFFEGQGFAFAEAEKPIITINKETKKIKATYCVKLNGMTIIDKTVVHIKFKKDPALLEQFIRNRIQWKDGDVYSLGKINELKDDLLTSGIFAGIDVSLSPPVPDKSDSNRCHTIVTINVEEALLRDISAGVKYGSSEKIGVLLSWTHYNVDGRGSKFGALVDVGKKTKLFKLKYDVYDIFRKKQKLANQALYLQEDADSYKLSKIGAESILWQNFSHGFMVGAGLCYEVSNTTDKLVVEDMTASTTTPPTTTSTEDASSRKTKFRALGLPFGLSFDTTDSYLDPQNGLRCSLMVTPYVGNMSNMTNVVGRASAYVPIRKNSFQNYVVISVYGKIGTIIRNKKRKIPRDKFFFSGGNNSIRGYGYQKIGPINDQKKPYGGESVFEIGVEPRIRISDTFGIVIFCEGGNVRSSSAPNPFKHLMFGYGFGIRYYAPLGPVRVDLAFPTRKRKTSEGKLIDPPYHFYISIGQAF